MSNSERLTRRAFVITAAAVAGSLIEACQRGPLSELRAKPTLSPNADFEALEQGCEQNIIGIAPKVAESTPVPVGTVIAECPSVAKQYSVTVPPPTSTPDFSQINKKSDEQTATPQPRPIRDKDGKYIFPTSMAVSGSPTAEPTEISTPVPEQ